VPSARRLRAPAALALALAAGCARKLPPTGGPPDLEPPSVVRVSPDSGATSVDRTGRLVVEFSEPMDPRSASLAVEIAPLVEVKARRWSGRKLVLVLADSLRANQTYTLFVGTDARDQHGNALRAGRAVPFTTASVFPAGRIAGDADRATATVLPALTSAAAKAQQHVNARNQASLQPLIDDLKAHIATASSATNGLAATVLAFTPAQWNANHGVLSGARTADQQADAALQKGRADVRSIRVLLRGA